MVIPKSANPDRIRENIDVLEFSLAPEDLHAIARLDRADGRIGADPATARRQSQTWPSPRST